jgi:hypothetical protein
MSIFWIHFPELREATFTSRWPFVGIPVIANWWRCQICWLGRLLRTSWMELSLVTDVWKGLFPIEVRNSQRRCSIHREDVRKAEWAFTDQATVYNVVPSKHEWKRRTCAPKFEGNSRDRCKAGSGRVGLVFAKMRILLSGLDLCKR